MRQLSYALTAVMEVVMHPMAVSVLLMGAMFVVTPAQALTYDPRHPVCMQVSTIDGNSIGCGYTTMAQCKASASGRGAQCFANPHFAGAPNEMLGSPQRRPQPLGVRLLFSRFGIRWPAIPEL